MAKQESISSRANSSTPVAWLFAMVVLLSLSATMLFAKLGTYPMIEEYGDEGFYLRLSTDIYRGNHIPFSLAHITGVSSQFPMTPLYPHVLAVVYRVAGLSFISARLFSSLVGLLIILVTARFAYRALGRVGSVACIIGFLGITVFWQAVQMTIPHGLASLLIISSIYCLYEFHQRRKLGWFIGAIACAIPAPFLTYWGFFLYPLLPVFMWHTSRRLLWWSFLPLVVFIAYFFQRWILYPQDFISDAHEMLAWQATGGVMDSHSFGGQILDSLRRSWSMIQGSFVVIIGVVGVFFLKQQWLRWVVSTTTFIGALFIFRDNGAYVVVIMVPFFALGFGAIVSRYADWLKQSAQPRVCKIYLFLVTTLVLASMVVIPFSRLIINEITPGYIAARQQRMSIVEATTRWLNARVAKDDFVVSPTALYWKLNSRAVDGTWIIAREEGKYSGVLGKNYRTRYRTDDAYFFFRTDLQAAKYVVFDKRFHIAEHQYSDGLGDVEAYLDTRTENWPVIYENHGYQIRQNPENQKTDQ